MSIALCAERGGPGSGFLFDPENSPIFVGAGFFLNMARCASPTSQTSRAITFEIPPTGIQGTNAFGVCESLSCIGHAWRDLGTSSSNSSSA